MFFWKKIFVSFSLLFPKMLFTSCISQNLPAYNEKPTQEQQDQSLLCGGLKAGVSASPSLVACLPFETDPSLCKAQLEIPAQAKFSQLHNQRSKDLSENVLSAWVKGNTSLQLITVTEGRRNDCPELSSGPPHTQVHPWSISVSRKPPPFVSTIYPLPQGVTVHLHFPPVV